MLNLKSIITLILCIISFSCTKQDRENQIIQQEKNIDTYINTITNSEVVYNNGAYRVINTVGTGEAIVPGDSVYFYFALYQFSNGKGTLYATNKGSIAKANNFPPDTLVYKTKMSSVNMIEGLYSGLLGSKTSEYCNIVFSSKRGFGNTVVYNIPKMTPLFYEVWIDKVIKN